MPNTRPSTSTWRASNGACWRMTSSSCSTPSIGTPPAIIKEWQDLVLENGWAYGPGGTKLAGRFLMSAISTGGAEAAYQHGGRNRFEIGELLSPFNQTAWLCSMAWLSPFVIHAGRAMAPAQLSAATESYRDLIVGLRDGSIDPLSRLAPGYTLPPHFAEGIVR